MIHLIATLKSKPEHLSEVKTTLENMVVQTKKETACIQYDLHQSFEDENIFVFYEIWESQIGLSAHYEQPYIKAFKELIETKLQENPNIYLTHKI